MANIKSKSQTDSFIRNLVFGVQDSFGSTLGFLSGVAIGGFNRQALLFGGTVLIFVEASAMAFGSLLSEHKVEEYKQKKSLPLFTSLRGPIIMFFSYIFTGLIPLLPYVITFNAYSLIISITFSLFILTVFSIISAKLWKLEAVHHLKETLLVGIITIVIGILVGRFFPYT